MSTRWSVTFQAICPDNPTKKTWDVGVAERFFSLLRTQGDTAKLARLLLVQEVLEPGGTERLYQGWSRADTDDCFVYVGLPKHDMKSLTIETPPPVAMLFLVFVQPDGTIDHWTWRPCSEDDPMCPSDVKGTLIWPQNQT
ncbi:MAG TPA: hypothetical protein VNH11_13740 [Pirellulales bacterium]|nr:hypothetical protein [Pirellulales bacterium]